jgi:PTS system nitrogen regulatory IIA component
MTMSENDFDIDDLAAYLHMLPSRVARLAEQGKLPARRVAGQWRFSTAEIHHWLEDRIGLSDNDQLQKVEGALDRAAGENADEVSIAELLLEDAIELTLDARTRGSVVDQMTQLAARTGLLWDPTKMAEAVRAREAMHPTALDNGVALLHPRRPLPSILAEAVLALGLTSQGMPFGNQGRLTDVFFLICSTSDQEHLRILARLSRVVNDADFLASLRSAEGAGQVLDLIAAREATFRDT